MKRRQIWSSREILSWEVMRPKEADPYEVLGPSNIGVLNTFNASARNCALKRSVIGTVLWIDISQLAWQDRAWEWCGRRCRR